MTSAVILGNGEPPSRELFTELMATRPMLLCADGGANVARQYGYTPDWVVGDLDSITAESRGEEQRVRQVDAENTGTDLLKVLHQAIEVGVMQAVITGVTGRRSDHSLWNLNLLKRFADQMLLRISDDYNHIYLIRARISFTTAVGQKVSLCPLNSTVRGISTEGLRWSLQGETLSQERDGISNEVISSPVTITVSGSGDLLLIIQCEEGGGAHEVIPMT
ncbi:MAG: thiamine diphosphokinase [Candidatus Latescibacterota bacterium]|nr:thiamine diphosphokinase [Candidatus Latescibacterota bacterium]